MSSFFGLSKASDQVFKPGPHVRLVIDFVFTITGYFGQPNKHDYQPSFQTVGCVIGMHHQPFVVVRGTSAFLDQVYFRK